MAGKHMQPEKADPVWREFKETGSMAARNELIERYHHLVRHTAERMRSKLPQNVETDDLMSAGTFGLIDAIKGFDLERGVKFETYCSTRIRGAILDELRSIDWVPRLVRAKANLVNETTNGLQRTLGRPPSEEDLARHLEMDRESLRKLLHEARTVSVTSLNDRFDSAGSRESANLRAIDIVEDRKGDSPLERLERRNQLERIMQGLSKKERLIVVLYYYEEMTLKEIGVILGLSESRICQIRRQLLSRLRKQMVAEQKELAA